MAEKKMIVEVHTKENITTFEADKVSVTLDDQIRVNFDHAIKVLVVKHRGDQDG